MLIPVIRDSLIFPLVNCARDFLYDLLQGIGWELIFGYPKVKSACLRISFQSSEVIPTCFANSKKTGKTQYGLNVIYASGVSNNSQAARLLQEYMGKT